jgi:hypothetical protein
MLRIFHLGGQLPAFGRMLLVFRNFAHFTLRSVQCVGGATKMPNKAKRSLRPTALGQAAANVRMLEKPLGRSS